MPEKQLMETIVRGSETYFRLFALAEGMELHAGPVEWIAPKAGYKGPSVAYRVALPQAAGAVLGRLLPGLQNGTVPPLWVVSPLSDPPDIAELLLARGFREVSGSEHPEYGMALETAALESDTAVNPYIAVRRVTTPEELQTWMRIVNTALHGWDLLTMEQYAVWLHYGAFAFYLGLLDGKPVATAAVITENSTATLEFVSTLQEHQNQGVGYAVCMQALRDLQRTQVRTVTLRSTVEGYKLYRKLGFQACYAQRVFAYQGGEK